MSNEETKKCPVCVKLVDVCKEVGEGGLCQGLLDDLYAGKMTADEFVDKLLKNEKIRKKLNVKT